MSAQGKRQNRAGGWVAAGRRRGSSVRPAAGRGVTAVLDNLQGTRLLTLALVALLLLLIVRPMVMSLLSYHRTHSLLQDRRAVVRDLGERNELLRQRLEYYKTEMYLAQQARQYGLVKPGEQPVVIRELAQQQHTLS